MSNPDFASETNVKASFTDSQAVANQADNFIEMCLKLFSILTYGSCPKLP